MKNEQTREFLIDPEQAGSMIQEPSDGHNVTTLAQFPQRIQFLEEQRPYWDEWTQARIVAQIDYEKAELSFQERKSFMYTMPPETRWKFERELAPDEVQRLESFDATKQTLQFQLERVDERERGMPLEAVREPDGYTLRGDPEAKREFVQQAVKNNVEELIKNEELRDFIREETAKFAEIRAKDEFKEHAAQPRKVDGFVAQTRDDGKAVDYLKQASGEKAFTDLGKTIEISKDDDEARHGALKLAAEKFKDGFVLRGDDEEKKALAKTAVSMGLQHLIKNAELKEFVAEESVKQAEKGNLSRPLRSEKADEAANSFANELERLNEAPRKLAEAENVKTRAREREHDFER